MYRPPAYVVDDPAALREFIRTRSFATIAAALGDAVSFAYAPVVLSPSGAAAVRFHLARGNPLARIDGLSVRLSFLGPDAYVSPDWYATEGLVPTWNYIAVEASGVARRLDDAELKALLADLSALHEEKLVPKPPWTMDKVAAGRMPALLNAIVGFEVVFETCEGKFKLSQDKKPEDVAGVIAGLQSAGDAASAAVAQAMSRTGRKAGA